MKNIIFIIVFTFIISLNVHSKNTNRNVSGGKENWLGFADNTYSTVNRTENSTTITINCHGSGINSCPASIAAPGPEQDNVQNTEDYAHNQININILTGNLFLSSTGLNVKWQAASSHPNGLRQIITWANGETEPNFSN